MLSVTSAVRWNSNPEDGILHPWLRNAISIISSAKWVIKTRVGLPIFLCDMCQASRGMGKMFTLYAFPHSYGWEIAHGPCFKLLLLTDQYHWCNRKVQTHCLYRAHGPCFRLLLLPDQYHWCNRKLQTHCSISKFAIRDEARLMIISLPAGLTLSRAGPGYTSLLTYIFNCFKLQIVNVETDHCSHHSF
jgi:hypothetical protein